MEIPYELKDLLNKDQKGFFILEPSLSKFFYQNELDSFKLILDQLGILSSNDRHLYNIITSFDLFFSSQNDTKKIILKCENDLIIGFISFGWRPILLRNEYNLKYFYKTLITVDDFYVLRGYQRMNYGKELFDKLILITNAQPVSMAFEYPNKALLNFLEKNYGISNPIYQTNNVITFYNYKDMNFNKYLDDYHRIIDVNKMEDDIENYRKWSPLDNDFYKRFNSDYSYKNIFPLKFKENNYKYIPRINNNRYNNIENNFIKNYNSNISRSSDYDRNNNKLKIINDYNSDYNNNINNGGKYSNDMKNSKDIINNRNQFHLNDKKNIYGKINNIKKIVPLSIKEISSNSSILDDKYFHKFNDYYLSNKKNINTNSNIDQPRYERSPIKDNYYNYLNDESRHFHSTYIKQKENEKNLNKRINRLNDQIQNYAYKTPLRNKNNNDIYYRKNRSFVTIFDSIENKAREEKDFNDYKRHLENIN